MFTIDKLDTESLHENGAWMHLEDPETGLPAYADDEMKKPVRIHFKGYASKAGKIATLKTTAFIAKVRDKIQGGGEYEESDIDAEIELTVNKLVNMCIGWENVASADGEFEFTKENARLIFTRYAGIRAQSEAFLKDVKNFTQA